MNLVIRLVLFCLLYAEGIETNPGPQTGFTRVNISRRGGPISRGCKEVVMEVDKILYIML